MSNQTYSLIIQHDKINNELHLFYVPNDKITETDRVILNNWMEFSRCHDGYTPISELIDSYEIYEREGFQEFNIDRVYDIQRTVDFCT